jgi:galactokinase/mevalonate kinase-like predicted kinase
LIKASAPGRCGIVGCSSWLYGGSVVSISTRERAQCILDNAWGEKGVAVQVAGSRHVMLSSADLALRSDPLDIVRAVLSALEVDPAQTSPISLDVTTKIPMEAGLGGYTAMVATVVAAMLAHVGLRLNLYETAELVSRIECDILAAPPGVRDQYMCVFGGLTFMDFRDKTREALQDPSAPFATVESLEPYVDGALPLIVAYAPGEHLAAKRTEAPSRRCSEAEQQAVDGFVRIAHLSRMAKKGLLAGQWEVIGALMNENQAIVRDLGASGQVQDRLIAAALDGGALGASLAGASDAAIVVLTLEPERTISALRAAGSATILYPAPGPGLTVEIVV